MVFRFKVAGFELCCLPFDGPLGFFDLGFDLVFLAWKKVPRLIILESNQYVTTAGYIEPPRTSLGSASV